jgi:hypothetical protein
MNEREWKPLTSCKRVNLRKMITLVFSFLPSSLSLPSDKCSFSQSFEHISPS